MAGYRYDKARSLQSGCRAVARRVRATADIRPPGGDYAAYLVRYLGRPMERALIKARQGYEAQKPVRLRTHALHVAYRRRQG